MRAFVGILAGLSVLVGSACSRRVPPTPTPIPTTVSLPSPTPTVLLVPTVTPTPAYIVHVVQPGDTLTRIARRYNTTVEAILKANPEITDPDFIRVGQEVKIPVSSEQ